MNELQIDYEGDMRCRVRPEHIGVELITDASESKNEEKNAYSPIDLLVISLGCSLASFLGKASRRKRIVLKGMRLVMRKEMSSDEPKRLTKVLIEIHLPVSEDHPDRKVIQAAIMGAEVRHSIHPDIEVAINWVWK